MPSRTVLAWSKPPVCLSSMFSRPTTTFALLPFSCTSLRALRRGVGLEKRIGGGDATTGGDADAAGDSWGEGVAIGESGGIEPESADSTDPLLFELIAGWLPTDPQDAEDGGV